MRWAVLLIHGVGDTDAGATLGAFLPPFLATRPQLAENASPQNRLLVEPAPHLPPAVPPPLAPQDETTVPPGDRFPMHFRRFRNTAAGQPEEVLLAEVFWADLARTGDSTWRLLKGAMSLIFDLRHLANVAAAHPKLGWARRLRVALYAMSWLLCGPVAGLTVLMLLLLLAQYGVLKLDGWLPPALFSALLGDTAVTWGGALFALATLFWRTEDETWSLFAAWLAAGGIIIGWVGLGRMSGSAFPWDTAAGQWLGSRLLLGEGFPQTASAIQTHVAVLLGLGYLAFALLAAVTLAALACWIAARSEADGAFDDAKPGLDVALGAALLQVLLWVILGTGAGLVAVYQLDSEYHRVLETIGSGFMLKAGVAGLLGLCAALVWVARRRAVEEKRELPRLIVHPVVLHLLIWLTFASMLVFSSSFLFADDWVHRHLARVAPFFGGLAVLAALLIPYFGKGFAHGLHVLVDITSHFHRKHLDPRKDIDVDGFDRQQRIEARCRRVLQELAQDPEVEKLTIIAHSQGTVIAIDVLWLLWAKNLLNGREVYLVTMGSPFTHLYQYYFPHRYPPLFVNGALNAEWGRWLNVTVRGWTNLFRVDDYIGTRVEGGAAFPDNQPPLDAGGHGGYWSEPEALRRMARYLPA